MLDARELTRTFGHVQALRGASLRVLPGEVVALVGDNGAGKSTLIKTLSGAVIPDDGSIAVSGQRVHFNSPADARAHGIETVYQDLALAPDLNAAENLYLGREVRRSGLLGRLGFVDHKRMRRESVVAFEDMGVRLPSITVPVSSLSGGQRQIVAVARAAAANSTLVFLDEPTAALAVEPAQRVKELILRIRDRGVAVVVISHDLPGVFSLADRIVVMRLGRDVGEVVPNESTMEEVVGMMTGAVTRS